MTPTDTKKTDTNAIPTHLELRAFIEKIAEFLQNFLKIFDQLKAGLAETFSAYERQF